MVISGVLLLLHFKQTNFECHQAYLFVKLSAYREIWACSLWCSVIVQVTQGQTVFFHSSIIEFLQSWKEILSFRSFSWLLLQATGLSRFFTDYYTVFLFLAIPLHQYLSRPHLPNLCPPWLLLQMLRWSRNDWDDSPARTKYFIPLLHCLRHC